MLVIRLSRTGKRKQPTYRLVVQEKRKDPWGKSTEIVGNYNPRTEPKTVVLKEDRIKFWLDRGAQPSTTVHNLLVDAKLIKGDKQKATTKDLKRPEPAPDAAPEPQQSEKDAATADEKADA